MIVVAVNATAGYLTTINDDAVFRRLGLNTHASQAIGHYLNTIAFFNTQLFSATQHGTPFGAGRRHK